MAITIAKRAAGPKLVPVRGDKQHHPAGQQDGARISATMPCHFTAAGLLMLLLERANAGCGFRIQNAGRLPAI